MGGDARCCLIFAWHKLRNAREHASTSYYCITQLRGLPVCIKRSAHTYALTVLRRSHEHKPYCRGLMVDVLHYVRTNSLTRNALRSSMALRLSAIVNDCHSYDECMHNPGLLCSARHYAASFVYTHTHTHT